MSKTKQFSRPNLPLTPPIFYILLSLRIKSRHGYEIMKQVRDYSNEKITLGPGTMYGAIKRLVDEGLIKEVEQKDSTSERRKYYVITKKGESILSIELERFSQALSVAQKWNIFKPLPIKFAL